MLQELRITDLGVIDEAVIEPDIGFTVVTGETGAGKTMVVTALGLIGGARADPARVRAGRDRAAVEVRWAADRGRDAWADAVADSAEGSVAGMVGAAGGRFDDDGSLILARTVSGQGRSRAHVGGRSVPLATLSDLTARLIAVHGQSEATSLLQPGSQRAVLDRFAGLTEDVAAYRELRARWQRLTADLTDRRARARERAQREQLLRLGLAEIEAADLRPGEDRELVDEVRRLQNLDALRSAARQARDALAGSEEASDAPAATGLVHTARQLLDTCAGADADPHLAPLAAELKDASAVLADVATELSGYLAGLDDDPAVLTRALERQSVLRALTRRYGPDVDAVLAWARAAAGELSDLDTSEERLTRLQADLDALRIEVGRLADRISGERCSAADRLGRLVTGELASLAMARATVRVRVTRRPADAGDPQAVPAGDTWLTAGPDGVDQVEVVMIAHPGAPELPIARGASGGELSRVMLALEVVLADADPVSTMVFDEVDAGVGGRAATEIGARLAALARSHQVIVVTHLAQVAAFADRHFVVEAGSSGRVGTSDVRRVSGRARESELARMLGGTDGATARAHARDLMVAARASGVTPLRRAS